MPFTADELSNIAESVMDFHYKTPKVKKQQVQERPLLEAMRSAEKTFPGGKEFIDVRVKGLSQTTIQGFNSDDTVTYGNPTGTKTAKAPWKLIHAGIQITMDELIKAGISVVDGGLGRGESQIEGSEKIRLANMLDEKIWDMQDGTDRGMNAMYWGDGTADPKLIPGIRSFILDNPAAVGSTLGIDRVANTWWRNRVALGTVANAANAGDQVLVTLLQREWRQLARFGGRPNLVLAGSDFIEQIERELRAKGNYTLEGWTSQGKTDASIADVRFKGVNFTYDPTLDDLGFAKRAYVMDTRHIYPMVVSGENWKKHSPARPENKYVVYKARTYVGGLICDQLNTNGVYSIA